MRPKYYTKEFPKVAKLVPMRDIPNYLLERGQHSATTEELQQLTGVNAHAVAVGMARLRTAGRMFTPAKGLHVVIPPEYRQWGAPPALDFIHPMMTVLHRQYYVAMLSAAELHGAAHQRAQVLQVMVQRHVSDRDFGRARFRFFVGRHVTQVGVVMKNSNSGTVRVSNPEVTVLDLASRPIDCGGVSNVATVIAEIATGVGLDPARIDAEARRYSLATLRRLGWILEFVKAPVDLTKLDKRTKSRSATRASMLLDPSGARKGKSSRRWRLVENVTVEPDL
jgi:predicted transcriptional regulator of viral defense system